MLDGRAGIIAAEPVLRNGRGVAEIAGPGRFRNAPSGALTVHMRVRIAAACRCSLRGLRACTRNPAIAIGDRPYRNPASFASAVRVRTARLHRRAWLGEFAMGPLARCLPVCSGVEREVSNLIGSRPGVRVEVSSPRMHDRLQSSSASPLASPWRPHRLRMIGVVTFQPKDLRQASRLPGAADLLT
jgi:hypothetical protein